MKRRDRLSKTQRSRLMSRIRSKNTKLDLAMKSLLERMGVAFEMYPKMIGNPDFLVAKSAAIFCDSGFWHGKHWRKLRAQLEKGSNGAYWIAHIAGNMMRDRRVNAALRRLGYKVLRFWDDEVFNQPERCISRIGKSLRGG